MKGTRCVTPQIPRLSSSLGCKTIKICGHKLSQLPRVLEEIDLEVSEQNSAMDDLRDLADFEDDTSRILTPPKHEDNKKEEEENKEGTITDIERNITYSPPQLTESEMTENLGEFIYWVHYDRPTVLVMIDFQRLPDRFRIQVDDRILGESTDNVIYSTNNNNKSTSELKFSACDPSGYDGDDCHPSGGTISGFFRIPSGMCYRVY